MKRRGPALWTIAILALLLPEPASALSCARPNLNRGAVWGAVAVFEGTAGMERTLSRREEALVTRSDLKGKIAGAENLSVYAFTVTRGWKGVDSGQQVEVLFNTYWGDGFAEGEDYLVVSPQQVGEFLWAPLCGHTVERDLAEKRGDLKRLRSLMGIELRGLTVP